MHIIHNIMHIILNKILIPTLYFNYTRKYRPTPKQLQYSRFRLIETPVRKD